MRNSQSVVVTLKIRVPVGVGVKVRGTPPVANIQQVAPQAKRLSASLPSATGIMTRSWRVAPHGFTGRSVQQFNRAFDINLVADTEGDFKWSNGGDGNEIPLVELTRPRCGCSASRLTFQVDGILIRYLHSSETWNPIGPNQFALEDVQGVSKNGKYPRSIEIQPTK